MKKVVIIIALALIVSISGYAYYSQVYLLAQIVPTPEYNTTTVRSGDISISASGVGSLLPGEKVSVGFPVSGIVAQLDVKVGDVIEAGQVLAQLDNSDAQLKLHQAELSLNSYFAPDALQKAEMAQLSTKADLESAVQTLEYLISPQVYYWENALTQAQAEMERLKAEKASSADLDTAQKAVEKAQAYLTSAKNDYLASYVWEVFPYSYVDEISNLTVDTYLAPTPDEINLARLEVQAAALAYQDAQTYLLALQAGPDAPASTSSAYPGAELARLDQARLDVATARTALEKTILKAPMAGTVTAMTVNTGQTVGTTPFLTIETLDTMALRFYIEESDLELIKVGNPVMISFEAYPNQPVEGQVTYLEPAMELVDGSPAAVVWAKLPENLDLRLFSGMSAEVEVIAGAAEHTLLVPVQALRELAAGSYAVFVVQPDQSLKMVPVSVGLKDYANAQILSGLKAGDVISTGTAETK